MAAKTLANLIAEVADRYGRYATGTATGGTTTTIVDTGGLYQPDDHWNGAYAYILTDAGGASAAPEGQERPVSDFVQSSGTATVLAAFTAAVAVGDTYELLPEQRTTLKRAINAGVCSAAEAWPIIAVDTTTVTLAADDYDYTLPTDVLDIITIWYQDDTDEPWRELPGRMWKVTGIPGAQTLFLSTYNDLDEDNTLRLEYTKRVSELATDASALGVGEPVEAPLVEYVVEHALWWLHDRASNRDEGRYREHATSAQMHMERADRLKHLARPYVGPTVVRGPVISRVRR